MEAHDHLFLVRCATLNLKGLNDAWLEKRERIVIQGLRELRPDIVCFQEAGFRKSTPIYHQAKEVGAALELPYVVFSPYGNPVEVMSVEHGGIAILSRWPFVSVRNRKLPPGRSHPPDSRVALFTCIDSPGGLIHVVNTHLSWRPEESHIRTVQIGLIIDDLIRSECVDSKNQVILAGDLNAEEDEPCIDLLEDHFTDAFRTLHRNDPGYTWSTSNPLVKEFGLPDRRLDYIFCSPHIQPKKCEIFFGVSPDNLASDHFAVMADFAWRKG